MDKLASFQFFGCLQDLIARPHEDGRVLYHFVDQPAVKDAIEALGIPHTEVDIIIAAGRSVDFSWPLQSGARVAVYPFGWPVCIAPLIRLVPPVPDEPRFILDVHLGKLARRLRLLGFDCRYRNDYDDDQIVPIALAEERIILTRDRGLLKRKQVRSGCLVNSGRPEEQLRAVASRYALAGRMRPLSRCPTCNGVLQPAPKEQVADQLQAGTRLHHDDFRRCAGCGQVYWHGSHTQKIWQWIERLRADLAHARDLPGR